MEDMENFNYMTALFQQKIEQQVMESGLPAIVVELVLQNVISKVGVETQKAVQQEQQKLTQQEQSNGLGE